MPCSRQSCTVAFSPFSFCPLHVVWSTRVFQRPLDRPALHAAKSQSRDLKPLSPFEQRKLHCVSESEGVYTGCAKRNPAPVEMAFLVPVGYCAVLEAWASVRNDHLVTCGVLGPAQCSDGVRVRGVSWGLARLPLCLSSGQAFLCQDVAARSRVLGLCRSCQHHLWPLTLQSKCGQTTTFAPGGLLFLVGSLGVGCPDLGSVLLCPKQLNADPHLRDAAEASSPCHEILTLSPKGLQCSKSPRPPMPPTPHTAICAAGRVAAGSAGSPGQIQAADFCL